MSYLVLTILESPSPNPLNQKIGKPYNIFLNEDKHTKGPKKDSQNWLRLAIMKKKVFLYVEYEYITGMTIIYYYPKQKELSTT
jgi:hypothetical protein